MLNRLPYRYRVFGLTLASEVELPELDPAPGATPDAMVMRGTPNDGKDEMAPARAPSPGATQNYQLEIEGVATFVVSGGNLIQIVEGVDDGAQASLLPDLVRLYLLGSGLATLLHQRQAVPLHFSAVMGRGRLWAFGGASGAGKSTLAVRLTQNRGYTIFSDDVIAADYLDGSLSFSSGPPRIKLWSDAVECLGIRSPKLERLLHGKEKYQLRTGSSSSTEMQLGGIFMLRYCGDDETPSLTKLRGREALGAILVSVYRPELISAVNDPATVFHLCAELARMTPVYVLQRPRCLETLDASMGLLLNHFHMAGEDDFMSDSEISARTLPT